MYQFNGVWYDTKPMQRVCRKKSRKACKVGRTATKKHMNILRKEAAISDITGRSKMSKLELESTIREVKFKDDSTRTDCPYCTPCVQTAKEVNLEMYMKPLRWKHIVHDGNLLTDQDTG